MANKKTEQGIEKSTNLIILETKENVINILENTRLPITVLQMLIKEVKDMLDEATNKIVLQDKIEYEEYIKNKKDGEK